MIEMLEADADASKDSLKDDQEMAGLEIAVRTCMSGRVRNLRLLRCGGGLELHGKARTYYVKQLAQHAIMKLTSCPIVANAIVVD